MAERRPLIIDAGIIKELPDGDTLPGTSSLGIVVGPVIETLIGQTIPELVFEYDNSGNLDLVMETL